MLSPRNEDRHPQRLADVNRNRDEGPVVSVPRFLEMNRLATGFSAGDASPRVGPYSEPADRALGEQGWFRRQSYGGGGVLGLQRGGAYPAEKRDEGAEPPDGRENQRSPLTRSLGEGAEPAGARQGSRREIRVQ